MENEKNKILIVDDQSSVLDVLGSLLQLLDYPYTRANNGRQALECLDRETFSLLISDIDMPVMNGLELIERVRQKDPFIGIIMLTGVNDVKTAVQVMKTGANEYLSKPLQFETLNLSIERCLEARRLRVELKKHQNELENQVRQRTHQLLNALSALQDAYGRIKESHKEMVLVLAKAAESNDNDTGHHIRRVAAYVSAIAERMGMGVDEVDQLARDAMVHDIGKVTIHPDILKKPGKLTEEEYGVMKTHTVNGAEILKESHNLPGAVNIALYHHERFDGKGYPHAIGGGEIPLEARITSIADVFDALTMRRCYKEAWPMTRAMDLIVEERGRQFDPEAVDAFVDCRDKIGDIRERLSD